MVGVIGGKIRILQGESMRGRGRRLGPDKDGSVASRAEVNAFRRHVKKLFGKALRRLLVFRVSIKEEAIEDGAAGNGVGGQPGQGGELIGHKESRFTAERFDALRKHRALILRALVFVAFNSFTNAEKTSFVPLA